MINYTTGNIFHSTQEALVNTVNLEGYMGKGIAYQFKAKFPKNNMAYKKACENGDIDIGKVFIFKENEKIIINFPTKNKWREKTKLHYIYDGLKSLKEIIIQYNIKSIAIPPLGCGNGGLDWNIVKPIIEKNLIDISDAVNILIYEPSKNFKISPTKSPKMSFSHLLLLGCYKHLKSPSKLKIQKTLFMADLFANINTWKFIKYKHGPYSDAVRFVEQNINDFMKYHNYSSDINGYNNAMRSIYRCIKSKNIEEKVTDYQAPLKRACEFVNSFENEKTLEIIVTLLHIITIQKQISYDEIYNEFKKYPKEDINIFSKKEIIDGTDFLLKNNLISLNIFNELEYNYIS